MMLLTPQEAQLFFKLYRSLMCFVNERLQIVPDVGTPDEFSAVSPETRLKVREAYLGDRELLGLFVDANPFDLSDAELKIVASWRHQVSGKFFVFRYLKNYAVFLGAEDPPVAYGVLGLTDPLEDMIGPYLPVWVETMLLPFKDKIVCDGLLSTYGISFGPGIRRDLNESYKEAKERQGIVTSLPVDEQPRAHRGGAQRKARRTPAQATPKPVEIEKAYPAIAKWVQEYGHIEIGAQQGMGFVVRALDYGGVVFEDETPRTLAEAMAALEKGLARRPTRALAP
jgi:hypothetical protein